MTKGGALEPGAPDGQSATEAQSACYNSALRIVARRDHSEKELGDKLRTRGFATDIIEALIAHFNEKGWLDDMRFAEGVVRYRRRQGYGPYYIKQALKAKGVCREIIDEVVDIHASYWLESAQALLQRGGCMAQSTEERAKLSRKLQRRGFAADTIMEAMNTHRQQ